MKNNLTLTQASEYLKVSPTRVKKLIKDGLLSSKKQGRNYIIYFDEIKKFEKQESMSIGRPNEKNSATRKPWRTTMFIRQNHGKTITETFSEIGEDSYIYKEISHYLKKHSKKGRFSSKWNKEDLMTLIALQSNISSKNQNKEDTRGIGTVEMIEFFDNIAKECSLNHKPEMAILSGSTHIKFDGKYRLSLDMFGRKIIAFNDTNNLNFPPNSDCVSNIKPLCFPGSVISIRFALSENQSLRINP